VCDKIFVTQQNEKSNDFLRKIVRYFKFGEVLQCSGDPLGLVPRCMIAMFMPTDIFTIKCFMMFFLLLEACQCVIGTLISNGLKVLMD
jgi:hypothetical protein